MAWFEGTATDYQDLLDSLVEFATASNVQSVSSIDAGGTGFSAGDLVNVSGGTSTTGAVLEVVTVSAGVVTAIRVFNGGAYSVLPATTQTGLTSTGGGSGLNVTLTTQAAGWIARVNRDVFRPISAVVNAGGTGYADDDVVTLVASNELIPTLIEIDDAVSGVASTISIGQRGVYTTSPGTTNVATTGGSGSGFTVDLTIDQQKEVILEGSGGGSDEIFVGIRTYTSFSGGSFFNWEVAGMQGFNTNSWESQPSISRGRFDETTTGGAFVPLRNVSMQYWMSITSNRIIVMALVGTNLASCFLGFIDPTSTPGLASGLYPYPLLVAGCSTDPEIVATGSILSSFSGFHDPVTIGSSSSNLYRNDFSCCQLNSPGNNWLDFRNSITDTNNDGGTERVPVTDRVIFPIGLRKDLLSTGENWPSTPSGAGNTDFTTRDLTQPDSDLLPTPGASGDEYVLIPLTMISYFSPEFVAGQIPDVFWFSAEGSIADNGSVINVGSDRYRVFQSGRYSDPAQWFAVRER